MIGLMQRVGSASVAVSGEEIAHIGRGILVFVGVEKQDNVPKVEKLLGKLLGYRVFEDARGKMNLSVQDVGGEVLLVPQFTLAADTNSGMRPGFSAAATPEEGKRWFDYLAFKARDVLGQVQLGRFGADMQVSLLNDGPVTFWLQE